ncbi:MAG: hypothetical protein ACI4EF_00805 [Coprococcus sp.]
MEGEGFIISFAGSKSILHMEAPLTDRHRKMLANEKVSDYIAEIKNWGLIRKLQ